MKAFWMTSAAALQIEEKGDTARHRIIAFLDKLKRCGPNAFPVFLEALKKGQSHLADLLSMDPGEDEAWSNPSSKASSRQGKNPVFLAPLDQAACTLDCYWSGSQLHNHCNDHKSSKARIVGGNDAL